MDKSTSPKTAELTTGTPDSKTPKEELSYFILHGVIPGLKEISNETWIKILSEVIYPFKPRLRYLDGLKTLEQLVLGGEWFNMPNKPKFKNVEMHFFPKRTRVNKRTRGFCVLTVYQSQPDQTQSGDFTLLVLTECGQWLEWNLSRVGLNCFSHFSELTDASLCAMLDSTKKSGLEILDSIHSIVTHSRIQKEQRLALIKETEDMLQNILNRARSFHH